MEKEEYKIRQFIWLNHGCPIHMLYGDDGEMQCAGTGKHIIDFKRDPIISIIEKLEIEKFRENMEKYYP